MNFDQILNLQIRQVEPPFGFLRFHSQNFKFLQQQTQISKSGI